MAPAKTTAYRRPLTMTEAIAHTHRSRAWIEDRVEKGIIHKQYIQGSRRPHYAIEELDAALHFEVDEEERKAPSEAPADIRSFKTIGEIAQALKVSPAYIWQLVHKGEIEAINISSKEGRGAMWRIEKSEYERFINSRPKNITREE
jgi:excisionase family DNA binding protein